MKNLLKKTKFHTTSFTIILLTIISLIVLRLFHLEADFPESIRTTTMFYTDEGWYSSAAQRWITTGNWYLEGDFNPATSVPGFQLILAGTFSLFGASLFTARLTALAMFLLLLISFYFFISRNSNSKVALIATFLVSINFIFFAYSRLALLEIPMLSLVFQSFLIADVLTRKRPFLAAVLASFCFSFAVLIKTSAIFAFLPLLFIAWTSARDRRIAIITVASIVLISASLIGGHQLWEKNYFPADHALFKEINFSKRLITDPLSILKNVPEILNKTLGIDKLLFPFTTIFLLVLLVQYRELRHHRLIIITLLCALSYFALLCLSTYQPRRYFLPFVPFFSVLFAIALYYVANRGAKLPTTLAIAALGISVFANSYQIAKQYLSIDYSWKRMIADLRIQTLKDGFDNPIILSSTANSIALDMPSVPINGKFFNKRNKADGLLSHLNTYQPHYYLSVGIEPEFPNISKYRKLEFVKTFDVFNNYHEGLPVMLFRVKEY